MRVILEPLKIRPEKFAKDYLISKEETKRKKAQWELVIGSQITLERHRRKFVSTEDHLRKRRLQFIEEKQELNRKWSEIGAEGQVLKDNFASFNHFLIANIDKRKRASLVLQENKKLVEQRDAAITDLHMQLVDLRFIKTEWDALIENHAMYGHFLDEVVTAANDTTIKNADHVLRRFEDITEVEKSLNGKQAETFEMLQNAKSDLMKFTETNQHLVMGLHTRTATLRARYEDARRSVHRLELLVQQIRGKILNKYTDLSCTKTAAYNLYVQICRRNNTVPRILPDQFEQLLRYIGKTLRKLRVLNDRAERQRRNKQ